MSNLPTPILAQVTTPQVLTRVHKIEAIPERTFWIGHILFSILAIVGLAFIIWASGPRRRDAILSSSASEGKE